MSAKEMEQMDNEVMGVVNGHATPESMANAEALAAQTTAKRKTVETYEAARKMFAEVAAEDETKARRKTLTVVILSVLLAAVLLAVMVKPSLLIWLVNLGVAGCCVAIGIALDRCFHRR